jgi:uncharacterized protein (TIGR02996 family)
MTTDGELLLKAIAAHPGERDPKLRYIDWCLDNTDFVRARIEAAMARDPRLTIWDRNGWEKMPDYDAYRAELLRAHREWAAYRAWLASRSRRRDIDWSRDCIAVLRRVAWELPEFALPWKRPHDSGDPRFDGWRSGPLIAAALDAGFRYETSGVWGTYLNVGGRLRPAGKPQRPKRSDEAARGGRDRPAPATNRRPDQPLLFSIDE